MPSPETLSEVQQVILAFLEEGPQFVADLARFTKVPQSRVLAELHTLRRAEMAQQVREAIWALAGYAPPPRRTPQPRRLKSAPRFCRRCRHRYAQAAGLCRRCARESGVYTLTTIEADAARLDRLRAAGVVPPAVAVLPPSAETRSHVEVINGVEFDVVSVGAHSLLGSVDGMHSSLLNPER